MLWIFKRWGLLVLPLSLAGGFLGLMAAAALPFTGDAGFAAALLLMAAITFALLWVADWKIQEGSGEVHYDAENDCPVVYEESSGSWMFVPFRVWMVLIPLIEAGLGVAVLVKILIGR